MFLFTVWFAAFLVVPLHLWKKYLAVGFLGLFIILAIDGTLVELGAFVFLFNGRFIYNLPLPYWLAYFPGGILFSYLRPKVHLLKIFYIPAVALVYLGIERIMVYWGYFKYLNWSILSSYILNLIGFSSVIWFAEWWEELKKESL